MTSDNILGEVNRISQLNVALASKIVTAARAVVPVLLDAGRTNSAKELQELFFEHDANIQALETIARENTAALFDALEKKIRGMR